MRKRANIANIDLFKNIFEKNREWLALCRVAEEEVAQDGSSYQVKVRTVISQIQALVHVTHDPALQSAAKKDDLWLCCFLNGDYNQGFLIQRLATQAQPLHPKSKEGETVLSSRPGKNINLSNSPEAELTEPAVLGNVLSAWLVKLCEQINSIASDLESLKTTYNTHTHPVTLAPPLATPPLLSQSLVTTAPERLQINMLKGEAEQTKLKSDLVFVQERGKKGNSVA